MLWIIERVSIFSMFFFSFARYLLHLNRSWEFTEEGRILSTEGRAESPTGPVDTAVRPTSVRGCVRDGGTGHATWQGLPTCVRNAECARRRTRRR